MSKSKPPQPIFPAAMRFPNAAVVSAIIQGPGDVEPIPVYLVHKDKLAAAVAQLACANWVEANGFTAKAGEALKVPAADGSLSAVLFGLGNGDGHPFLPAQLEAQLPHGLYAWSVTFAQPGDDAAAARMLRLATLGFALSAYRFDALKQTLASEETDEGHKPPRMLCPESVDFDDLSRIAHGVALARDLINLPAGHLGPTAIEQACRALAKQHDAAIAVIAGDGLLAAGYPMIHAVGRASADAPRLIDLVWGEEDAPRLTLVGKGVAFDTGGLDIKPASNMRLMKKDMGGAANVLGLAHMIMDAGLPVRLRVLIPAVENAISGNALRPGDVLTSRKGKTVEIGNTDAEGRLILADALTLADSDEPELIIDMATLTGAARVALGTDLPALFCDDDAFSLTIMAAGEDEADPSWRLPLHKPYKRLLKSTVADMNNISSGGFGGAITAALFLDAFVEQAKIWAHIDLYGWSSAKGPGRTEGGEAQTIRAIYRALCERFQSM